MSPSRFPIHLCLVSTQPVPNLVPVLDPQLRPERVVLVVSQEMRTPAFHLESVLRERGVPCERLELADAFDPDHVLGVIGGFLDRCDCGQVALNATGGTKIMAFAAHQMFIERGLPVFYLHPERDEALWLHPRQPSVAIRDSLQLDEYLRAHGVYLTRVRRESPFPGLGALTSALVAGIENYARALSVLNFLAGSAENDRALRSLPLRERDRQRRDLTDLIKVFEQNELVRLADDRLVFPSEEARFFINGGWFEQHIFETVLRLKQRLNIRDCAMGLEIHSASGTPNELDVAFLWNNRLHLIECKTRKFADQHAGAGAETLYKLDTLSEIGGPQTRSLLASYQELPGWDRQRARDLGIGILVGPALRNLEYELLQWITG